MKKIIIFILIFLSSCSLFYQNSNKEKNNMQKKEEIISKKNEQKQNKKSLYGKQFFKIYGNSMYPTLEDGDYVYIDNISNYNRNDIVIFKPGIKNYKFIERIIGIPGDTIKIVNGWVYLKKAGDKNFQKLNETFLNKENFGKTKVHGKLEEKIYIVPKGKFFIMGDNRIYSADSRTCFSFSCKYSKVGNFIDKKDIIGVVKKIGF